jgi:hypothetical protein
MESLKMVRSSLALATAAMPGQRLSPMSTSFKQQKPRSSLMMVMMYETGMHAWVAAWWWRGSLFERGRTA